MHIPFRGRGQWAAWLALGLIVLFVAQPATPAMAASIERQHVSAPAATCTVIDPMLLQQVCQEGPQPESEVTRLWKIWVALQQEANAICAFHGERTQKCRDAREVAAGAYSAYYLALYGTLPPEPDPYAA